MNKENIVPFESGKFEDGNVVIDDVSITYMQNADCTENKDDMQEITISSRNNGVSRFLNIKTSNWSISDESELVVLIQDFVNRAGIIEV